MNRLEDRDHSTSLDSFLFESPKPYPMIHRILIHRTEFLSSTTFPNKA